MKGKVRLLGKTFPAWIVAAAIIASTAGAATGVVLAGKVTGEITATVSQALTIAPSGSALSGGALDAALFTQSDDGTRFTAGAQVNTGDSFRVDLALANNSGQELTGELSLFGPDGIQLSIANADDAVANIVQTGPFTWKFRLGVTTNAVPDMLITVALADDLPPGFYAVDGTLKQVAQ